MAEKRKIANALNDVKLTRKDFALIPDEAEEINRRDLEEYKARHPELFSEYNIRLG